MKRKYIVLPALIILALLSSTIIVSAMTGGEFSLPWTASDGGGATFSSGGDFSLGGTIGQPEAGPHTGGDFTLLGGFWVQPPPIIIQDPDSEELPDNLPSTGFSPNQITNLPLQPKENAYLAYSDMWLEIPKLNLEIPIVGVPLIESGWDVQWLGEQAGYLAGTAFPTWAGNTAITAHVWNADNTPGPFVNLKELQHGDQFSIHAYGQVYTYEVRDNVLIPPDRMNVFEHSDYDAVNLLTCENWSADAGEYRYRRAITAVLVDVAPEME